MDDKILWEQTVKQVYGTEKAAIERLPFLVALTRENMGQKPIKRCEHHMVVKEKFSRSTFRRMILRGPYYLCSTAGVGSGVLVYDTEGGLAVHIPPAYDRTFLRCWILIQSNVESVQPYPSKSCVSTILTQVKKNLLIVNEFTC